MMPSTVDGVLFLLLRNGAPNVFSSIVAFVGTNVGYMDLNNVLGSAVLLQRRGFKLIEQPLTPKLFSNY